MDKLRIVLVDDHEVVRGGLRLLIESQADMEVIGEASDGQKGLEIIRNRRPDVAIIDITMPNLNGVELTTALKQSPGGARVLILTAHEEQGYLHRLLEAGAAGYVLKRSASHELIRAIRAVAEGQTYLDANVVRDVVGGLVSRSSAGESNGSSEESLSDRERQVLRLIAQGYSNKEIAAQLDVSIKSVETYKARSMEKLGLRSRAEIVRYALDRGWLHES